MAPTSRQAAAVRAPLDRCVLVNAGPGTGKTHVLVERFLHLVGDQGLAIDDVLVVTFGREAARELRDRIARRLLEAGRLRSSLELERAWIQSFHGLCFRLLREHGLVASFDPTTRVLDTVESAELAARARRRLLSSDVATRALEAEAAGDPLECGVLDRLAWRFDHAIQSLARARESLFEPEDALALAGPVLDGLQGDDVEEARAIHAAFARVLPAAARSYEELKAGGTAVDFVDLEVRAVRFLESRTGQRLRGRWKAVLVDELQDTNHVQLRLLELLGGERLVGFTAVGDERQAIYGFRGARLDNIRGLPGRVRERGGACDVLDLTESFRSYQEILDAARGVLPASTTLTTPLEAVALGSSAPRRVLRGFRAASKESEAEWIAARIAALRGTRVTAVGRDGARGELTLSWGHFALLLRGVGKSARAYEDALRAAGIPYRTIGGTGFYDRREVLDLLAYLKAISNPYDGLALVRILQNPPFGLSDRSLHGLANLGLRGADEPDVETDAHEAKVVPGFRLKPYDAIRRALDQPALAAELGLEATTLERLERLWAFLQRCLDKRGTAPVSRLLQDVLVETGYGKLLLADERSGPLAALRRRKNVERLLRMARRHEERHVYGSLEELVRTIDRALEEEVREEEEAVEADDRVVNVMTVHQAKGLEWPVVFVGGLTDRSWPMRGFPHEVPFFDEGGIVLRTAVVGVDDGDGKLRYPETCLHAELSRRAAGTREEEERRLLFVAMTRAKNLLHLSGWGGRTRWLDEVLAALPPAVDEPAVEAAPAAPAQELPATVDSAALEAAAARVLDPRPPAPAEPEGQRGRHVSLSFTQVDAFLTCPLRYELTYVVPLPSVRHGRWVAGASQRTDLAPAELGAVFHEALERWAVEPPPPAGAEGEALAGLVEHAVKERGWAGLSPGDEARTARMVASFLASRLGQTRPAPGDVEVPFALRLERPELTVTLTGAIDRLDPAPQGGWWITDYKTNRGVDPERYALQLSIYRLAVERVLGRAVAGAFAYFVRHPAGEGLVEVATLSPAETEDRLFQVAERIAARDFALAAPPEKTTCWRCPFGGYEGACQEKAL